MEKREEGGDGLNIHLHGECLESVPISGPGSVVLLLPPSDPREGEGA